VLAAGGLGIAWFDSGSAILGFIPGHREGHYRVPTYLQPPRDGAGTAARGRRARLAG
jgi:hypothetical protein